MEASGKVHDIRAASDAPRSDKRHYSTPFNFNYDIPLQDQIQMDGGENENIHRSKSLLNKE